MIELIALSYLSEHLDVPVYAEVPAKKPERFVVLHKGGSQREDLIDTATMIADSYAESLLEAARLNEQVKNALDDLTQLAEVSASRLATDYPFPDTESKQYRYQAVYQITHY